MDHGESCDWESGSVHSLKIDSVVFFNYLGMENENEGSWVLWGVLGFNNWKCTECFELKNITGRQSLKRSKEWFSTLYDWELYEIF